MAKTFAELLAEHCGTANPQSPSDRDFKALVLQGIVEIIAGGGGGGGGTSGPDVEVIPLVDDQGIVQVPFFRIITTNALGVRTVANTTLDGTTAYTPTGTVIVDSPTAGAASEPDTEVVVLLDNTAPGTYVPFVRTLVTPVGGGVPTVTDRAIDGVTPYTPTGTVIKEIPPGASASTEPDTEVLKLFDNTAPGVYVPFLRRVVYPVGGGVPTTTDTALDGTTVYAPTGTVVFTEPQAASSSSEPDTEVLRAFDNTGPSVYVQFLRRIVYPVGGGAPTITDTTLDGTTPYVVAGTVVLTEPQAASTSSEPDTEVLKLFDNTAPGTYIPFLRRVVYPVGGGAPTTTDTTLDGATVYAPAGSVVPNDPSAITLDVPDTEILRVFDNTAPGTYIPFIRRVVYPVGGGDPTITDTTLDGATAYVATGTVVTTQPDPSIIDVPNTEVRILYDNNAGVYTAFFRKITYPADGSAAVIVDTTLDGLTPYVTTGTVVADEVVTPAASPVSDLPQTAVIKLFDTTAPGVYAPFLRKLTYPVGGGTPTIIDTTLDGTTSYTTVGAVLSAIPEVANEPDNELVKLYDDNAGTITPFLRRVTYPVGGGAPTITDTTLDGTTVYAPTGTILSDPPEPATSTEPDTEVLRLFDNTGPGVYVPFLRRIVYPIGGGTPVVTDTTLDGNTAYTTTGTVVTDLPTSDNEPDNELVKLFDNTAPGIYAPFLRRITYPIGGGAPTFTDTTLDGATAYTVAGTVVDSTPDETVSLTTDVYRLDGATPGTSTPSNAPASVPVVGDTVTISGPMQSLAWRFLRGTAQDPGDGTLAALDVNGFRYHPGSGAQYQEVGFEIGATSPEVINGDFQFTATGQAFVEIVVLRV